MALAAGKSYSTVESELKTWRPTIARWKARFEKKRLSYTLIAIVCASCTKLPEIRDYPLEQIAANSQRTEHAAVVVATIQNDRPVGPVQTSRAQQHYNVQLHQLRIHVENLLRGRFSHPDFAVYYFHIAQPYDGVKPLGSWHEHSRWIFYLVEDSGVQRIACDVAGPCAIPVKSGAHSGYMPTPDSSLHSALADILLTPGSGVNDQEFADSLPKAAAELPTDLTVARLHQLASRHAVMRESACGLLQILNSPCTSGAHY